LYIYIFQLKVLEKQQNNLNQTLDKGLQTDENATDKNVCKACNETADDAMKRLDEILTKINERATKAGVSTDATTYTKTRKTTRFNKNAKKSFFSINKNKKH
jgi:hypothetical protein